MAKHGKGREVKKPPQEKPKKQGGHKGLIESLMDQPAGRAPGVKLDRITNWQREKSESRGRKG